MLPLRVPAVRALAVHACVARACASHARVACTLITPAVRALAVRARAVCTFVLGVVPAFPTVRHRGMETGISEASKRVSIFSFATQGGKQVSFYF